MSVKWWKYKDTDTLNRLQYEEAIEIQDIMIKKKFITKYMDQRFRFHILQNIHRKALRDNKVYDQKTLPTLSKAIISKNVKKQHSSVYGVLGNKEIKHKPEVVEYNSGKIMMTENIEYKGDNNE